MGISSLTTNSGKVLKETKNSDARQALVRYHRPHNLFIDYQIPEGRDATHFTPTCYYLPDNVTSALSLPTFYQRLKTYLSVLNLILQWTSLFLALSDPVVILPT